MQRADLFAVLLLVLIARTSAAAEELKFGILPYITATELIKKYTPLVDYLSQILAIPVKLSATKDYKQHVDLAGINKLDIAFVGGLPYLKMVKQYGKKRLFACYEMQNKPYFRSIIFVSAQSSIQSLYELADKSFAFGNKNSTLSTLVPRYMLQQMGVGLADLFNYDNLATHEDVVLSVLLGSCDVGAMAQEVFNEYKEQYQLRELTASPAISTHILLASDNLSDALFNKIQMALLNLDKHADAAKVLTAINKDMTGFVPVQDSDYDTLRNIIETVTD
ncbi:phosphate/phosphite/phosphonate ABC transporter substrate-binding protein [Candidatus Albibeggiatoa sp. nov. BB20]|uniref:phosphate/phosphite/phosphonate ABC transporter substrate-binding protein n=1 Tax=Candidatus Albibeggiatoa sp. nov. BB20 TaxID=3162723 RepID=UPI0033653A30